MKLNYKIKKYDIGIKCILGTSNHCQEIFKPQQKKPASFRELFGQCLTVVFEGIIFLLVLSYFILRKHASFQIVFSKKYSVVFSNKDWPKKTIYVFRL